MQSFAPNTAARTQPHEPSRTNSAARTQPHEPSGCVPAVSFLLPAGIPETSCSGDLSSVGLGLVLALLV